MFHVLTEAMELPGGKLQARNTSRGGTAAPGWLDKALEAAVTHRFVDHLSSRQR
jgi:hypothetical protein